MSALVMTATAALGLVALSAIPAQGPVARWAVDPKPTVTIGLDDTNPAALLQKIVSATRLPNGGILVGDLGDYALKQFSATGKYERSFGRKGGGPGETRARRSRRATSFRCSAPAKPTSISCTRCSIWC